MPKHRLPESIDLAAERKILRTLFAEIQALPETAADLTPVLRRHPRPDGSFYAKSQLMEGYRALVAAGEWAPDPALERRLRGRPVRTISGVAPVAILTEPYPCPGDCLFCPTQREAPKSYLDGEPGVLRGLQFGYDPYTQTASRIAALDALGHATDKVELLILGGTWSSYPEDYRSWFLRRAFDALNTVSSATLEEALALNETAPHRNVGLVIETRPDSITPEEVASLRRSGVTKVQLGAQSFDEHILALNQRGHTADDTRRAMRLLRLAGFKIVLHWMPNLYGATPESDRADFARMWDDPALRPDEIKIYPTALLKETELFDLWRAGKYQPYPEETLIELLRACKRLVPPYCRINRLMRDIPAQYIVAGTTKSNLRQIVQDRMRAAGEHCRCIRCRELRESDLRRNADEVRFEVVAYDTDATKELFIQALTEEQRLAGFVRLSLPLAARTELPQLADIRDAAMVRELHVYGTAQALGQREGGAQHRGLGTALLDLAASQARAAGFRELAVIAAVGTRHYYRERGFTHGDLYPIRILD